MCPSTCFSQPMIMMIMMIMMILRLHSHFMAGLGLGLGMRLRLRCVFGRGKQWGEAHLPGEAKHCWGIVMGHSITLLGHRDGPL